MKNFELLSASEKRNVLMTVLSTYVGLSLSALELLIEKTSVKGVQFVKINDYKSAASNGTETADQLINIGASYDNMLKKDAVSFENLDLSTVNVNNFDYSTVNTADLSLEDFKQAVLNSLPIALAELCGEKKSVDTSATIKFNSALSFNMNTCNLNVHGMQVNKTIKEVGEKKFVKSAPKTIAKKLIQSAVNSRASKIRQFTIQNISKSIKVNGSELYIV